MKYQKILLWVVALALIAFPVFAGPPVVAPIGGSGSGDVTGPGSSTDNAITRFNGAGGDTIQNSTATLSDTGTINIPAGQEYQIDGTALAPGDIGAEVADATILKEADVDDVPVDGATTAPASSNRLYDHENASNPHSITADGILPSQTGNSGKFLTTDGTNSSWGAVPGGGDLLSTNNLSDVANASTALSNLGGQPADADTSKTDVEETFSAHKTMADDIRFYLGSGQDFWFVFNSTATQFEFWTTDSDGGGTDAKIWAVDVGGLIMQFFGAILTAASATPTIEFRDSDDADSSVNAWIEVNLTDAGSGTQDADMAISALKAGAKTAFIGIDADATNPVDVLDHVIIDTPKLAFANVLYPESLTGTPADKIMIFHNTTSSNAIITAIYAESDVTGENFVVDEYDFDGASNTNEIDDVTCSTGSGPYTASIESGISHTTIEPGHKIYIDYVSGTGTYFQISVFGYYAR